MPQDMPELVSPTSLALLSPLMSALDPDREAQLKPMGALPAPCLWIPAIDTVACATPIHLIALFRTEMISLAASAHIDVAIMRHGFHPETLDAVSFDVVIGRSMPIRMLWDLCAYRHEDGSYWLIPPVGGAGPSVRITAEGIALVLDPPYRDLDQRSDGASRAARETVLAMRRMRRS